MTGVAEPVTDADIVELARDLLGNRVYTSDIVPPECIPLVFMPVAFGAVEGLSDEELDSIVVFAVTGRHQTTHVAIDGYPTFLDCRIWSRVDFRRALDIAEQTDAAMNAMGERDDGRKECPECHRRITTVRDGRFRIHGQRRDGSVCPGEWPVPDANPVRSE